MSLSVADCNIRPAPDRELVAIADYVVDTRIDSEVARKTAPLCLMDALGCGMLALRFPECAKLLGPVVPGTVVPVGARVPGTSFLLDPVQAAFSIGTAIRWLDYNDTWLAAEWGHPSDNLGAILSVADYVSRRNLSEGKAPLAMRDVLGAMVKAYEIQGVLALENAFNRVGLDHVVLVKVASTAVATRLLGGGKDDIVAALSHAWIDGQSLRTYRHAPNTGPRKSWAAGDAASRAVRLALLTLRGEPGYPAPLSAPVWGFCDVHLKGDPLRRSRPYGAYVMENVLFKIAFPAEFHAQTAVEAAISLHPQVKDRLDEIARIVLTTQESAVRIISKTGPLHNPADRDHCLQYMVAAGLLFGELNAEHYEDAVAADPRLDLMREKMEVVVEKRYTRDYLDPEKRSIANAVEIFFRDGTGTGKVEVEYPLGHRRRREEGLPFLLEKFRRNLTSRLPGRQSEAVTALFDDPGALERTPVNAFMDLLVL